MGIMKNRWPLLILILCTPVLTDAPAQGADWPQWRGPHRNGSVTSASGPGVWTKDPSLLWSKEIGEGHASPVTSGGKIFLHSRQGEDEVVSCLNLEDGTTFWRHQYPAPYEMDSAAYNHGKGPKSTPVVQGGKVFTLGISGILSCLNRETGELLWRHDFIPAFKNTSPLYGTAMSPIVAGDLVVAHVGGNDAGALQAFHQETGEVKWSWDGDGPGYASPILVTLQGVQQLVTQSQQKIIGIALEDGSELWQIPFATPHVQNIVTPIAFDDLLVFSGFQKGTFAIRLSHSGQEWLANEVWSNSKVSMYMSSPVIADYRLFGFSHYRKGQLFALDARSGEILWTGPGRQGDSAALLLSKQLLFVLTTDAELLVVRNTGDAFEEVSRHRVADSPTWAHPVIEGSKLLIKDSQSLALWSFPE
jgi:outer membrane protein assembly factor BamB